MFNKKLKSFTLIELLVVIVIIGILTGFIFVSLSGIIDAARDAKVKSDLASIQRALMAYSASGNILPDTEGYDCELDPESETGCDNFKTSLASYLPNIPTNPNGDLYIYSHDAGINSDDFSIGGTLSNNDFYSYSSEGGWSSDPSSPPSGIVFTPLAHFSYGSGSAMAIEQFYDQYYLANGTDGVRVFTFNGSTVTNVAHVDTDGTALDVYPGNPVYVADGSTGYKAYAFDGSNFTLSYSVNSGGEARSTNVGWSNGGQCDIPYLANGTDGLRAYSPSLSSIANIDDGGEANEVDLCSSYVLLANGTDGLRVYTFNEIAFSLVGNMNPGIGNAYGVYCKGNDNMIFLANGTDGLRAYTYYPSLAELSHVDDGGEALGVYAPAPNWDGGGYIFLANGTDGLRIYEYDYDNNIFILAGHIDDGGEARSVAVSASEDDFYLYIFLANGSDGVRIYQINNPNYGSGDS
ncbi:MAG: prepilin-type N-terminal cleavage/methylation domain-containing protein [Candidatus Paceibacterota bacterium]